jgi:hypothetical protein
MDSRFFKKGNGERQKGSLHKRLASGKGNSASGTIKIGFILEELFDQILRTIMFSRNRKNPGKTLGRTEEAFNASPLIEADLSVYQGKGSGRAKHQALAAAPAFFGYNADGNITGHGFGIMTPGTAHVAALQKNRGPYSGTIMGRKPLNRTN